eukprot:366041-Chlamydomonas_euryale.AAC.1
MLCMWVPTQHPSSSLLIHAACSARSTPIFETLYLIVTFGHELPPEAAAKLDPPDDFFRVRMVCALLGTCGTYFGEGRAAKKLDRFLVFFQVWGAAGSVAECRRKACVVQGAGLGQKEWGATEVWVVVKERGELGPRGATEALWGSVLPNLAPW